MSHKSILEANTYDWDYSNPSDMRVCAFYGRVVWGWYFFVQRVLGEGWKGYVEKERYAFKRFTVDDDGDDGLMFIINKMKAFASVADDFSRALARESRDRFYTAPPRSDEIIGLSGPYGGRVGIIEDRVGGWHAIGGGKYGDMVSRVIIRMGL